LGNGDGTFQPPVYYPSGGYGASSVAIADVNGDGKPDILVANADVSSFGPLVGAIGVLLNNGDGTFRSAVTYSVGSNPANSLAVADLNGDGKPDIVVASSCPTFSECDPNIEVLMGNGDGTFQYASSYSSGGYIATSLAIGDVNGDGKPDIVVSNSVSCVNADNCSSGTGAVGVLLGNGDGTFQAPMSYSSGGSDADFVTIADVNSDGSPDLVVFNECVASTCAGGGIGVLLGNGDGTFQTAMSYSSGIDYSYPGAVVAADLNGDGRPDVAIAQGCVYESDCISVLLNAPRPPAHTLTIASANPSSGVGITVSPPDNNGQSNGTTQFSRSYNNTSVVTLTAPSTVAGATFSSWTGCDSASGAVCTVTINADRTVAVDYTSGGQAAVTLASNSLIFPGQAVNTTSVAQPVTLTNTGNATLAISAIAPSGDFGETNNCPASLAANTSCTINVTFTPTATGTRNGAITITDNAPNTPQSVTLTGTGASNVSAGGPPIPFVNQPLIPTTITPGGPQFSLTVNGTGFVPGATVDWNGTALATNFVNAERLTATVPAARVTSPKTVSITVVNGASNVTSNVVFFSVSSPESTVTFANAPGSPINLIGFGPVALGDFNGDGKPDMAVIGAPPTNTFISLIVLLGNGDGTFVASSYPPAPSYTRAVGVGDFNGDGKLDLAVTAKADQVSNRFVAEILLGNGDGTFQPATSGVDVGVDPLSVAVGDFNGDGKLDMAVANSGDSNLTILLGNGDGTFTPAAQSPTAVSNGNSMSLAVGDFNRDGKLDLAVANGESNSVTILLGNGDGTFTQTSSSPATGLTPGAVAVGDFNGDGKLDFAVADENSNTVTILLGNGDGTFTPTMSAPATGDAPIAISVGDINGDGKLDLAVANKNSNNVTILLGNGDGTFTPAGSPPSGGFGPESIVLGDFNGDGRIDLASGNGSASGNVSANLAVLLQVQVSSAVTLSSPSLIFPDQTVNTTSAAQPVTLTNAGNASLTISAIAPSGDFGETNNCPSSLPANTGCTINVTFTPTATGTRNGAITITDNAPNSPQAVTLAGTGIGVAPAITSANGTTFTVGTVGSFTVRATGTPAPTLGENGSLPSGITFNAGTGLLSGTPAAGTNGTYNITFTANNGVSPTASQSFTLTVSPSSSGGAPVVSLSSTTLFFETQSLGVESAPQSTTVMNNGTGPLTITDIEVAGALDYSVAPGSATPCSNGLVVAAGAGCVLTVTFEPVALATRTGTVAITDNAPGSPQSVGLNGYGMQGFSQYGSPASFDDNPACVTNEVGCALTSMASLLTTFDPSVTPSNLNVFLTANGGYCDTGQKECDLVWAVVPSFIPRATPIYLVGHPTVSVPAGVPASISNSVVETDPQQNLQTYLNAQVVQAQNRVILGLQYTAAGASSSESGSHFVFVTGPDGNADWQIFDPNNSVFGQHTLGELLAGFSYTSPSLGPSTHIQFSVTSAVSYGAGNGPSLVVEACSPVELLLTDPDGQLVGNSGTGNDVIQLQGATYARDFPLANDTGSGPAVGDPAGAKTLYIPSPLQGVYAVSATSSGFGPYSLSFFATSSDGSVQQTSLSGFASPGSSATYDVNESPVPGVPVTVTQHSSGPQLGLSANALPFGNQSVGAASTAQSLGLADTGTSSLVISNISITGSASGDFAVASGSTCPSGGGSVATATACAVNLVFTPTAPGTRSATLTITDSAPGSPHTVALSGTGIGPAVSLPGNPTNFSAQIVGTTSMSQSVMLGNPGNATLTVTGISITGANSGDFAIASGGTCPAPGGTLGAGATCMVNVTFTPTATGTRSAALAFSDNAAGSPQSFSISGTATDFSFGVGSGGSTSATITAGQTATYDLQANSLNGFTGQITITCSGAPSLASCSPSTGTITVNGSAVPFSVMVTTTANSALPPTMPLHPLLNTDLLRTLEYLALVLGLYLVMTFSRRRKWRSAVLALVAVALVLTLTSCSGGGGNSVSSGGTPPPGTPPNTYTLTVSGMSGGATRPLSLSLTVK
jgi:hypothetical protein